MQENNFEKQVQEKTNELKLKPSDEVWQKVSAAIAKGKADRRVLAFFLLLLLVTCSTVFIVWEHRAGNKTGNKMAKNALVNTSNAYQQETGSNTQQVRGAENITSPHSQNSAEASISGNKPAAKNVARQQRANITLKPITSPAVAIKRPHENNTVEEKTSVGQINKKHKIGYKTRQQLNMTVSNGNISDLPDTKTDATTNGKIGLAGTIPGIAGGSIKKRITDTVSNDLVGDQPAVKESTAVVPAGQKNAGVKKSMQSKQRNNWKLGFNFSLGASTTQNGYLGIIGSANTDLQSAYASNPNQSNNGGVGQGNYYSILPSKIKTGMGVLLGVFAQKNISPKLQFSAGLNYKRYTSRMVIGARVDSPANYSLANYYFRSGNTSNYKNTFHFIELPVEIKYRLGKENNKLPVYLNAGVAISRLISVHALQFSPLSGNYYKDDAIFNKTQFTVSFGLLFSLSGNAGNPLLIGPDINLGLNKMAGSGLYENRHYSYFGLLLQRTIGKK